MKIIIILVLTAMLLGCFENLEKSVSNQFVCDHHGGKTYDAQLIEVDDGDTASFETRHGKVSVRYWGVDTPESEWPGRWPAQPHSKESIKYNTSKLHKGNITITFTGDNTWNRCVGEVFVEGKSLSLSLIERGHGWWNKKYAPDYTALMKAESKARLNRLGLWSRGNPEPPWSFRQRHPRKQ